MKTGQPLLVPDARQNEAWKANPHVRLGMISYLGFPIGWPDGRLFGTICVRDNKRNEYSEAYLKLMLHFRDMLQADLKSFATLHSKNMKPRSGVWSTRTSSESLSGILKVEFLTPMTRFFAWCGMIEMISRRPYAPNGTDAAGMARARCAEDAELRMTGPRPTIREGVLSERMVRVPVLMGVATFEARTEMRASHSCLI